MAFCYCWGRGCVKDEARSLELAVESSGRGSRYGQCTLGMLHRQDAGDLGLAGDDAEAASAAFYRLAAAQGLDQAQFCLGWIHELKTTLKRCGGSSLLPPKDILQHCTGSLFITITVSVLLETMPRQFDGTGARIQRVTPVLQPSWSGSKT
jgi:hypothetical protein